jgi:hypothetical protein
LEEEEVAAGLKQVVLAVGLVEEQVDINPIPHSRLRLKRIRLPSVQGEQVELQHQLMEHQVITHHSAP